MDSRLDYRGGSRRGFAIAVAIAILTGCASLPGGTPDYAALVAAADRTDADRANDARRKPREMLAFIGLRAGMRVLDLGAGAGYSTELLARAVGPQGTVYAQNSKQSLPGQSANRLAERPARPAMRNVVSVTREFDDPVPPEAAGLDVATFFYVYHDTPLWGVDRTRMNRRIFQALRSGGIYVVADHAARDGVGTGVTGSLHRIEEAWVRREVEAAGFRLVEEAQFLRNPADAREQRVFGMKIPVDNFVMKFVKP